MATYDFAVLSRHVLLRYFSYIPNFDVKWQISIYHWIITDYSYMTDYCFVYQSIFSLLTLLCILMSWSLSGLKPMSQDHSTSHCLGSFQLKTGPTMRSFVSLLAAGCLLSLAIQFSPLSMNWQPQYKKKVLKGVQNSITHSLLCILNFRHMEELGFFSG